MTCPSINKVYKDKYCEYDSSSNCKDCLKKRYGLGNDIIENWQKTCKNVLSKFDLRIVPSENTQKLFKAIYPELDFEVVEHGVEVIDVSCVKPVKANGCFNVAFVGAMAIHKGGNILKELKNKNVGKDIKIHLFGKSEIPALYKSNANYINHGPYTRGELPKLLIENGIDLVCIFATWPETYSYTLTECYMAHIPVLTFDLGAVGDRVKKDNLGWTIEFTTDSDVIFSKIKDIKNNKTEYDKIKSSFDNYSFKKLESMQDYYESLYLKSFNETEKENNIYSFIEYKSKIAEIELQQTMATYGHVINRYEQARHTLIWRIAKKIKSILRGI